MYLGQRLARRGTWRRGRNRFSEFDVGGVIGIRTVGNSVFAGISEHVKLMRAGAAYRAGVRRHRAEFQPQPREDACIALVHFAISGLQIVVACMKRIRILHHELASAHHAKTRADFIAKLGLNLIKIQRQLAVTFDFAAHHVADDFFVRGAETEVAVVAVFEPQEFRAVLLPARGFNPQFGRLHRGHGKLNRAAAIHFFADDGFHFAQHAQAQRHPGINPAGEALDQPRTQHEFMADDFGLGRGLFQRGNKEF